IAAYEAGVLVYDISDPANPVQVGSYKTYYGPITETGAWGVYAYFGTNEILAFDMQTGLYILSLDNPPALVGRPPKVPEAVAGFPNSASENFGIQDQTPASGMLSLANPGTDQNVVGAVSNTSMESSSRSIAVLEIALKDSAVGEP